MFSGIFRLPEQNKNETYMPNLDTFRGFLRIPGQNESLHKIQHTTDKESLDQ
jgi:hypothetical protein